MLNEGDVLKADNTRYADADLIALTNNGLLYFFSSLKLTLAGQTVDKRWTKDVTKGWFPDISSNAAVNNTGFYTRQGYLIRNPNPKGSFQCAIPMRHMVLWMTIQR